jgi:hypothetical protein
MGSATTRETRANNGSSDGGNMMNGYEQRYGQRARRRVGVR